MTSPVSDADRLRLAEASDVMIEAGAKAYAEAIAFGNLGYAIGFAYAAMEKAKEQPSDDYCGIVQMSEEDTGVPPADEVERVRWDFIEYGYEKIAIQDERGTEIGFVHRRRDADLIRAALSAIKGQQSTVDELARLDKVLRTVGLLKPDQFLPSDQLRIIIAAIRNGDEGRGS